MPNILQIVQNTPLWVFVLLAALIVTGLQALGERSVPVWRILLVPAAFIAWGGAALVSSSADLQVTTWWGASAAFAALLGWATANTEGMRADARTGSITIPGSAAPLIRNLTMFTAKYCLTVALVASAFDRTSLIEANAVISGISAGFFAGWLLRFARWYWTGRLLERNFS